MTYQIKDSRLIGTAPLTVEDFECIAQELGCDRRRKIGFVAALTAATPTRVITYRQGKETENITEPGDFIVTNLLPQTLEPLVNDKGQPDQYVIRASRFSELYSRFEGKE